MDRIIDLNPETAVELLGYQNNNVNMLTHIFPKLKIVARGTEIKVSGADEEVQEFENRISLLESRAAREIETLLADTDLFERYRLALLET